MMKLSSYYGNPYIGVYCAASEGVSFIPIDSPRTLARDIEEALGVEIVRCNIASTNLLGALLAMNSHGAVITSMASKEEKEFIAGRLPVYVIEDRLNASGNNILANDKGALVNPDIGKKVLKKIEQTLQVEVAQGTIAGHKTVGSVCAATNRGVLCHPAASDQDLEMLRSVLRVPTAIGTLNYGTPLVGACMVANSRGAAVGFRSTPIELGRVEDSLSLI